MDFNSFVVSDSPEPLANGLAGCWRAVDALRPSQSFQAFASWSSFHSDKTAVGHSDKSSPFVRAQLLQLFSHCPPLPRALRHLLHGALGIARQHFRALVPALRSHLCVAEISVGRLGEPAVTERGECERVAQSRSAEDVFYSAPQVRNIAGGRGPGRTIASVAAEHQSADALAPDRVKFRHELWIERNASVIK